MVELLKHKLKQEELLTKENHSFEDSDADIQFANDPFLTSIIKWYRSIDQNRHDSIRFLALFIDNLVENLPRSPNTFRYNQSVKDFAVCLYIFGGKQAYEFVRLNLYGSIPNLSTIQTLIREFEHAIWFLLRRHDWGFAKN